MTKLTLGIGILVIGVFAWVLAEEKKQGEYRMVIEGIDPRKYDGPHVAYDCEIKPISRKEPNNKRFYLYFLFKRDVGPIGVNLTVYKDKSTNKKGDWNSEGSFDVKKICECDYGLKNFIEHFKPKEAFKDDACGIVKGNSTVLEWTIDDDLHDAFDSLFYGYYKIRVCLSDKYDMQSQQMDYSECFLEFHVTGEIVDASKKKCKKDDKKCKENEDNENKSEEKEGKDEEKEEEKEEQEEKKEEKEEKPEEKEEKNEEKEENEVKEEKKEEKEENEDKNEEKEKGKKKDKNKKNKKNKNKKNKNKS